MASQIFLSYSRADRPLAERFVTTAIAHGVDVWFDERIEGGDNWRETIVKALSSAEALVILFSEHTNQSTQLIKELAVADRLNKLVIPVRVSACEPRGAYLYELASRQWVDIHSDPEGRFSELLDHLSVQLASLLGIEASTRPPATSPAAPETTPKAVSIGGRPAPPVPAASHDGHWFPLGAYDLFIVVPVLLVAFSIGLVAEENDKIGGLGLSVIASAIYMVVISVRNARLNRSITSGRSFASYATILIVGATPIFVSGGAVRDNLSGFLGVLLMAALLGLVANGVQVLLRKVFSLSLFRSNLAVLGSRPVSK